METNRGSEGILSEEMAEKREDDRRASEERLTLWSWRPS